MLRARTAHGENDAGHCARAAYPEECIDNRWASARDRGEFAGCSGITQTESPATFVRLKGFSDAGAVAPCARLDVRRGWQFDQPVGRGKDHALTAMGPALGDVGTAGE